MFAPKHNFVSILHEMAEGLLSGAITLEQEPSTYDVRMKATTAKILAEVAKVEFEKKLEWEKLRNLEEERLLKGLEKRLEFMEKGLNMAPPECKTLPRETIVEFLNKLMATMDYTGTSLAAEDIIKKASSIKTPETETSD
jgi:hypothetical protein